MPSDGGSRTSTGAPCSRGVSGLRKSVRGGERRTCQGQARAGARGHGRAGFRARRSWYAADQDAAAGVPPGCRAARPALRSTHAQPPSPRQGRRRRSPAGGPARAARGPRCPRRLPLQVLVEAEHAAKSPRLPSHDATDIPLFTIDPPASTDLDQAMHLSRRPGDGGHGGYRVRYAIADVAAFVTPGGALDAEVHRRVTTLYFPDGKVPLHPACLSEGAASLLPDHTCPAVLWTLDLDADGRTETVDVRRALVRSRAKLNYAGCTATDRRGHRRGTPRPAQGDRRTARAPGSRTGRHLPQHPRAGDHRARHPGRRRREL